MPVFRNGDKQTKNISLNLMTISMSPSEANGVKRFGPLLKVEKLWVSLITSNINLRYQSLSYLSEFSSAQSA